MTNTDSKAPTFIALHVKENNGKKFYQRIGCAWIHKDGNGLNLKLDYLPPNNEVLLRKPLNEK